VNGPLVCAGRNGSQRRRLLGTGGRVRLACSGYHPSWWREAPTLDSVLCRGNEANKSQFTKTATIVGKANITIRPLPNSYLKRRCVQQTSTSAHTIGALYLGYLAMVAEFGYAVVVMPSGLLMRRQFFSSHKTLPIFLSGIKWCSAAHTRPHQKSHLVETILIHVVIKAAATLAHGILPLCRYRACHARSALAVCRTSAHSAGSV
jgi:hypothetical protein